ncbi:hypothetical protein EVAR_45985_1 [Eumeta japonica]|uniref:Uncharacterized protein n=1 Tax=Eumeta variegata TaxID=151549 RepID=A0A4C1XBD8_EUMVA|nr:hypothetical protein EVAR_45985_1 [Eumeta japonica]
MQRTYRVEIYKLCLSFREIGLGRSANKSWTRRVLPASAGSFFPVRPVSGHKSPLGAAGAVYHLTIRSRIKAFVSNIESVLMTHFNVYRGNFANDRNIGPFKRRRRSAAEFPRRRAARAPTAAQARVRNLQIKQDVTPRRPAARRAQSAAVEAVAIKPS